MFLQQAMSPWFTVHRVSQVTMISLTIAVCFLPLLYQPQEAEALADPVTAAIIIGSVTLVIAGVAWGVSLWNNMKVSCPGCGDQKERDTIDSFYIRSHAGACNRPFWSCEPGHDHYETECANLHTYPLCVEERRTLHKSRNCYRCNKDYQNCDSDSASHVAHRAGCGKLYHYESNCQGSGSSHRGYDCSYCDGRFYECDTQTLKDYHSDAQCQHNSGSQ